MFTRFFTAIERQAGWVVAAWVAAAVMVEMTLVAPSLNDVGSEGTADFLPANAPSQQGDRILAERFPDDPSGRLVGAAQGTVTIPAPKDPVTVPNAADTTPER